ncbi:MAG: DUF2063 domain-containing protein [Thiohalomonadales bacterium]
MQNLRLLQQTFAESIFQTLPLNASQQPPVWDQISTNGLSAARRVQVYRNNVYASYTEALASIFKVSQQLVGEEFFQQLASLYIPEHRSINGNIHQFGHRFADFIEAQNTLSDLPYLADVARLEWAQHEAFHAPAATLRNIEDLSSVAEDTIDSIVFAPHPATRTVSSLYPILSIWRFHQQDIDELSTLNIDDRAESVLVARPQLEVELQELEYMEFALLSILMQLQTFARVCAKFSDQYPGNDVGAYLRALIQKNIVTGFTHQTCNTTIEDA